MNKAINGETTTMSVEFSVTKDNLSVMEHPDEFIQKLFLKKYGEIKDKPWDTIRVVIVTEKENGSRTYEDRKESIRDSTERVNATVEMYPGITSKQLATQFPKDWNYTCTTYDNKLRQLRKEGRIASRKGTDGLLHWYPTGPKQ